MTARAVLLKFHLYLGLAGALFLIILGLTGSIIAFENDIEHWLHPGLWYVRAGVQAMPEQQLVRAAETAAAPARVASIEISRDRTLVQLMHLNDGSRIFVNPYDGTMRGRFKAASRTQKTL